MNLARSPPGSDPDSDLPWAESLQPPRILGFDLLRLRQTLDAVPLTLFVHARQPASQTAFVNQTHEYKRD